MDDAKKVRLVLTMIEAALPVIGSDRIGEPKLDAMWDRFLGRIKDAFKEIREDLEKEFPE